MVKRPFEDIRPLGPFADFSNDDPESIKDIRNIRERNFYTALRWVNTEPKRLYHATSLEGLDSIADDEAFIPPENALPEMYLSAAPEEQVGELALVLDVDNMIDKGFSPRCATTFTLKQLNEEGFTPDSDYVYETERGYIISEWNRGYIDSDLFSKYKYPGMDDRLLSESDHHCYSAGVDEWCLEPYNEFNVSGNPPYTINLAPAMQQTFTMYVKDEIPLSKSDVKAVLFGSGYDVIEFTPPEILNIADTFNAKMMSFQEASKRYEELRGGSTKR